MMLNFELDKECSRCHGSGTGWTSEEICSFCKGRCRELTEAGEAVLDFVSRWMVVDNNNLVMKKGRIEGP